MSTPRPARPIALFAVVLACSAGVLSAQNFGTSGTTAYTVGACDAIGPQPGEFAYGCAAIQASGSLIEAAFPLHLPTGALVTSMTVNYYDASATDDLDIRFFVSDSMGSSTQIVNLTTVSFSGGYNSATFPVDPPWQVDNTKPYSIFAFIPAGQSLFNVQVYYQLQVAPAPATATFGDVPATHPFFQYIEALAASGITGGCGGGNYCPDNPLTRGQMAVFLAKALGLYFPN